MVFVTAALALQLELVRHSLSGTHYRYRQFIEGRPVVGGEVNRTVWNDGRVEEVSTVCSPPAVTRPGDQELTLVNDGGVARYARRVEKDRVVTYVDARSGRPIRVQPRFAGAKPARVFEANPVKTLDDSSLQDQNNATAAVPPGAYSLVTLENINAAGPLGGPYCQIVDLQLPAIAPVDSSEALLFDRGQSGFEDVNAYFQIDRSQRYLQSLGYTGNRAVAPYPLPVDPHGAGGDDISFFIPAPEIGRGMLIFGDGGTDDAEDPDLVVHEYAHAVHEWIAPGTFLGPFASEARAVSEGFADYWGFSASYAVALRSGRDPFCFADWDARCWLDASSERCAYPHGSDCLRRLDSRKTMRDFNDNESNGTQYLNGEIWSSALAEILVTLTRRYGLETGKKTADILAVESLFGAPPEPAMAGIARRMVNADRSLNHAANTDVICATMMRRGILADCAASPRGQFTLYQSADRGVAIPDNEPAGITVPLFVGESRVIDQLLVQVDIEHPVRGDLRISLLAPDGTVFRLQVPSNDRSAGIHTTFGRDSAPIDPLDGMHGRTARGEWRLHVADWRPLDAGKLLSWSLVIRFDGDSPAAARPSATVRQFIPVVGRGAGGNGDFASDVSLLNRSESDEIVSLLFTPDGADGRSTFSAAKISVPAGTVVTLHDIVGQTFGASGLGQLEIDGPVVTASRTYIRRSDGGTPGEFISPSRPRRSGVLIGLYDTSGSRSNVGFAETAGHSGSVFVRLVDATSGALVGEREQPLAPYGHVQFAAHGSSAMIVFFEASTEVVGYGSVIDNRTGDAVWISAGFDEPGLRLAPAISGPGVLGTRWTTTLWVAYPEGDCGPAPITYTEAATLDSRSVIPVCRRQLSVPDAVALMFDGEGTRGVLSMRAGPTTVVREVIANDGFRQSVAFLAPSAGAQDLLFVEKSEAFRTNVGLMSDVPSSVRVTLFDAAGRRLESSIHSLAPFGLDQFPIEQTVTEGRVRIEALTGRVAAYASRVDNLTGDGSFSPAQ